MAIDLAALKAKIAAQKAAAPTSQVSPKAEEKKNETPVQSYGSTSSISVVDVANVSSNNINHLSNQAIDIPTVNSPAVLGTSKTTEIDHLDFITKMNSLSEAIHRQHPTMPVLLMQIHKQLRSDPELVTTLDDDAIGIIVKGLQIQTKTELVVAATSTKGSKKKGAAVSLDML